MCRENRGEPCSLPPTLPSCQISLMPVKLPWRPVKPANPKSSVCWLHLGEREHCDQGIEEVILCLGRFQFPFRLFLLQQTHWETCISSFLSLFVHDTSKCAVALNWLECLCLVPCMPGAMPACCCACLVPCLHAAVPACCCSCMLLCLHAAMLGAGHCVPR